jgi:hypothetical protein
MRAAALILTAFSLVACVSTPEPKAVDLGGSVQALPARPSLQMVGTLATNACEALIAPHYTQAIVAVATAAARVRAGTLDPARARTVLEAGREARAQFDAACPNGKMNVEALEAGRRALAAMQSVLEATP